MKKLNLIFDFDGTVADTAQLMLEFANRLLGENGYPEISAAQLDRLRKMTILQGMRYLKIPLRLLPKGVIRARQLLHERLGALRPYPGMPEVLRRLHQRNDVTLGMVSSNSKANVEAFLSRHKLKHVFDFIDVSVAVFGKHLKLRQTMRRHHLDGHLTCYIGDEIRDIEAARKTDLKMIAVAWGLNHRQILSRYKPDHLVDKPAQILDIASAYLLLK